MGESESAYKKEANAMGVLELHFYGPIDGHFYGDVWFYVSCAFRPSGWKPARRVREVVRVFVVWIYFSFN